MATGNRKTSNRKTSNNRSGNRSSGNRASGRKTNDRRMTKKERMEQMAKEEAFRTLGGQTRRMRPSRRGAGWGIALSQLPRMQWPMPI